MLGQATESRNPIQCLACMPVNLSSLSVVLLPVHLPPLRNNVLEVTNLIVAASYVHVAACFALRYSV